MTARTCIAFLAAALCIGGSAQAAGTLDVAFVAPEKFTDFGYSPSQTRANVDSLTRQLRSVAERRLHDGQSLKLEVLDVDLAGSIRPWRMAGGDPLRVVRDLDSTRMHLRYTLDTGDGALRSGDEWINGSMLAMDPLWRDSGDHLRAERRMLDDWLQKRLAAAPAAP